MDPKWSAFKKWLRINGCPEISLELCYFNDTGRGLAAVTDISDEIVKIPIKFMLTREKAAKIFGNGYSTATLLTLLICHCSLFREWKPYIDLLPTEFTTACYIPKDIIELLPPEIQQRHEFQLDKIHKEYELVKEMSHSWIPTFNFFKWAWVCVSTRSICLNCEPNPREITLVPFLDCLNHSPHVKMNAAYNIKEQSYVVKTDFKFEKNNQVFINYGPHDNVFLLSEYGFITRDNPFDHVNLDADFPVNLPAELKGDLVVAKNEIGYRLMNASRYVFAIKHGCLYEWEAIQKGNREYLSINLEFKVLKFVADIVNKRYHETLCNLAKLKQKEIGDSFMRSCCIGILEIEIDILKSALAELDVQIASFASKLKEQ